MVAAKRSLIFFVFLSFVSCSFLDPRETYQYIEYPVKKGDTFYSISARFDVPVKQLLSFNDLDQPVVIKPGDWLKVPYHGQSLERRADDYSTVQEEKVVEMAKPKKTSGKTLQRITLAGAGKYVGNLAWPTDKSKTKFSSKFNWRWSSFHEGIDLAGPKGTPIYAAHSGQVVFSGKKLRGYGLMVVIKGDGLMTVYGHNRRNRVSTGEWVEKGERIADIGDSGKTSGPHLHFETRIRTKEGKYAAVDPMIFY